MPKNKTIKWETPVQTNKDFKYWSSRFKKRKIQYDKTKEIPTNKYELTLPNRSVIAFIGDQHIGSAEVDYDRIEAEINRILKTPNSYVILMGDTVDGYFWGGEAQYEEMEQVPEQIQYINSMMDLLSEKGRLIGGILGDHHWASKKAGYIPLKEHAKKNNCFYSQGVTYITINIGKQQYRITAAHRFPGSSMYNKNHPQIRALRFGGAIGADIVVSGHNHSKQYSQVPIDTFGGDSSLVHLFALGAYKTNDGFGRKLGLNKITTSKMYGSAVVLDKKRKHIGAYYDILEALDNIKK